MGARNNLRRRLLSLFRSRYHVTIRRRRPLRSLADSQDPHFSHILLGIYNLADSLSVRYRVHPDEEKSIYKWMTSHSFDSQVATALWTQYNAGADSGWFAENLLVHHSVSLLNPQPSNENQDGPSASVKSKLTVARTLYRQEMARRATRLVQDHRRRGLSPPVPYCQPTSNITSPFVLTDHKYASLATCIECVMLSIVFLWVMSNPQGNYTG